MDRFPRRRRIGVRFRPQAEAVEGRQLLSLGGVVTGALGPQGFLRNPPGYQAVRPNTPVLPFGSPLATATFIDPAAHIVNGNHVVLGQKSYVAPYATLDAQTGFIKIGSGSDVLDNAVIDSNPQNVRFYPPSVLIGDVVSIGYGATVLGPSSIGAYGGASATKATAIGPNALIDGAIIQPGAVVGALARVGPGVVIRSGMYVLPGANVTNDLEASDPALGKVEAVPASVLADAINSINRGSQLAAGYTNLYQGSSATGANIGVDPSVTGVNNGNLAAVEGVSSEPGPATSTAATGITFEPSAASPKFPGPHSAAVSSMLPFFPARITGDVRFTARAHSVANHIGRHNSIRGDQGQPIRFANAPVTGPAVTINSPLGGTTTTTTGSTTTTVTNGGITVGQNFQAGPGAVLLGGPGSNFTVGNNVTIGGGAVVNRSSLGNGVTVGPRAYVSQSTVAAGTVIPAGEILINNKVVGQVQW